MIGGVGADILNGGTGNDSVDYFEARTAVQVNLALNTGNGNDTYSVSDSTDSVDELGSSGIDSVRLGISFNLSNSTKVKGGVENLPLTGTLDINAADNAPNNLLTGNSGDNRLADNAGADTRRGGTGDDIYSVDQAGDVVAEATACSGGIDQIRSAGPFRLSNAKVLGFIENLDLLEGGNFNGAGNGLNNSIDGHLQNNDLMGLGGNDVLTGFRGADVFVFNAALNAVTNVDTITDFNVVDDTMRLGNAFMTALTTGQLSASAFHIGAAAADASDRIIYDFVTGSLSYDADGAGGGAAVRFARLDTELLLSDADFFVI